MILTREGNGRGAQGAAGMLIPPREPEALAQTLRRLIEEPPLRENLSQAGRTRAERRYSIGSVVESYRQLSARLAGSPA